MFTSVARCSTTLFPYTTLFRSRLLGGNGNDTLDWYSVADVVVDGGAGTDTLKIPRSLNLLGVDNDVVIDIERISLDRKSTRLNSSHLVISYAVYCWKKKNTHLR